MSALLDGAARLNIELGDAQLATLDQLDAFDWATARGLAKLPVVIELCAPFLAAGGLLVAQRSGDLDAQLTRAAPAFKALHLWSRTPIELDLPGLEGHGLIVGEKYA